MTRLEILGFTTIIATLLLSTVLSNDKEAMEKCQETYSFQTCHQTLHR